MTYGGQGGQCPPELLNDAVSMASSNEDAALRRLDELAFDYPADAAVHFLHGALLASARRYTEARTAMARALAAAPGYALARFQLGMLELTAGEPAAAEATWAALETLAVDHPLRLFSVGLRRLARDDFTGCAEALNAGIARNSDNEALNGDMRRILAGIKDLTPTTTPLEEASSSAQLLLQQYRFLDVKH